MYPSEDLLSELKILKQECELDKMRIDLDLLADIRDRQRTLIDSLIKYFNRTSISTGV